MTNIYPPKGKKWERYVPPKLSKTMLFLIALCFSMATYAQEVLNNYNATVSSFTNRNIQFTGSCHVTITNSSNPLSGSTLNLMSSDIWLYFPNILPSSIASSQLSHIVVSGAAAVEGQNVRVVQYLQGTMVISHSSTFLPLTVYANNSQSGTSMQLSNYTYYKAAELGSMNDNIQSFVLKRGYMATFAENEDGTGYSKNYIADDADVIVSAMPTGMSNTVSFVRVIPWRWTAKKGWARTSDKAALLNASWQYDWNNEATSSLDIEYIPMRHNKWWNAYSNIQNKTNSTHALHFNEPNNSADDGYATVEEALAQWPQMLASGLRVGTPAPTDGGAQWLYDFVAACRAANYRIDFVAIHFYRGGQSTSQFYNFLADIHNNTGLPIWITEFNNGANWTCCDPTYTSQAETIDDWMDMLESAPFVERYAIYENVEETRQMFYSGTTNHTPAGIVYRDKTSTMAYTAINESGVIAGQTYSIVARNSNKALEVYQQSTANNAIIDQWSYWGGNNQKWKVQVASSGYYKLININSGKAIDVGGTTNGSTVQQYSYWGGDNQQWSINNLGNGYFSITSKASGRALDISSQSTANGAPVLIWDYWGGNNQQYTFNLISSGSARITEEVESPDIDMAADITLFPNPAANKLQINAPYVVSIARIYTTEGKLIQSASLKDNQLDISSLDKGVYILQFSDGENRHEMRFIKSN